MTIPPKRDIPVYDHLAHNLLLSLEQFLGPTDLSRKVAHVERVLSLTSGLYRQYWVAPNSQFWLGLAEALATYHSRGTLAGLVTPRMREPLSLAAKLDLFRGQMHPDYLRELRRRILSADYLFPVLFEIDTASHFWQLGYEIQWPGEALPDSPRSVEFIANLDGRSLEVECKAQSADSGRRIVRPVFYRLSDRILASLNKRGYCGKVLLTVPERLPASDNWTSELLRELNASMDRRNATIKLSDSSTLDIELAPRGSLSLPLRDLQREVLRLHGPHVHMATSADTSDGTAHNPTIFRLASSSPDAVLLSYLSDLREANHQVSGANPAVIHCFVPEISSFEGLAADSALNRMTSVFFQKHASPSIYAVVYVSDAISIEDDLEIASANPALSYPNPNYDTSYGERFEILANQ